jgi:PIN domain nuclease of toxin-antitoxin system
VRLLLDTHAFLWLQTGDARFSRKARRRVEDRRNDRYLSIASVWEMAIKIGLGKLRLGSSLEDLVERGALENGIALLPIAREHALGVTHLPRHHGDPFDRLLVAQAVREEMAIVAADPAFDAYPVRRVW